MSRLRPFICGKWFDGVVSNFDFAENGMRLNPGYPLVRHEISNRFAIPTDDDGFAVRFQFSQQAGKVGFCFVNIHFFIAKPLVS